MTFLQKSCHTDDAGVGGEFLPDCDCKPTTGFRKSPEIVLRAIDPDEDFIDAEGIAVALMVALQSSSIYSSEFDAQEPDGFIADCNTSFSQEIFNAGTAMD